MSRVDAPWRRTVLSIGLLIGLAACGDGAGDATTTLPDTTEAPGAPTTTADEAPDTTEAGGGDMPDVCAALTSDDVNRITGFDAAEGVVNETISNENQVVCEWVDQGPQVAFVQVLVIPGGGDQVEGQRQSLEDVFEVEAGDASVPGADGAYVWEGLLGMAVGGDFVQVSYVPSGPADDVNQIATELATVVTANLGG